MHATTRLAAALLAVLQTLHEALMLVHAQMQHVLRAASWCLPQRFSLHACYRC